MNNLSKFTKSLFIVLTISSSYSLQAAKAADWLKSGKDGLYAGLNWCGSKIYQGFVDCRRTRPVNATVSAFTNCTHRTGEIVRRGSVVASNAADSAVLAAQITGALVADVACNNVPKLAYATGSVIKNTVAAVPQVGADMIDTCREPLNALSEQTLNLVKSMGNSVQAGGAHVSNFVSQTAPRLAHAVGDVAKAVPGATVSAVKLTVSLPGKAIGFVPKSFMKGATEGVVESIDERLDERLDEIRQMGRDALQVVQQQAQAASAAIHNDAQIVEQRVQAAANIARNDAQVAAREIQAGRDAFRQDLRDFNAGARGLGHDATRGIRSGAKTGLMVACGAFATYLTYKLVKNSLKTHDLNKFNKSTQNPIETKVSHKNWLQRLTSFGLDSTAPVVLPADLKSTLAGIIEEAKVVTSRKLAYKNLLLVGPNQTRKDFEKSLKSGLRNDVGMETIEIPGAALGQMRFGKANNYLDEVFKLASKKSCAVFVSNADTFVGSRDNLDLFMTKAKLNNKVMIVVSVSDRAGLNNFTNYSVVNFI